MTDIFKCLTVQSLLCRPRCCLHSAAHLHVLHRLLAYRCNVHRLAHLRLEHPETRRDTSNLCQLIVQYRPNANKNHWSDDEDEF